MRILIIEDEHYAAKRMQNLLLNQLPDATILAVIDTVEDAVSWLSSHVEPNLIFMDIQLADGLSFQIFEEIKVQCPIIFTTAFDEYALNAFKVNSIDYLLKPIEELALKNALDKYQKFFPSASAQQIDWNGITKEVFKNKGQYKSRFLIKTGQSYAYLNTGDIQYLFSEDGLSFACDEKGKKYLIDQSLDKIEDTLDPDQFFKISRKHIIALQAISKVHPYLNGRLKLELNLKSDKEFIVSRDKSKDFKSWLDK